MSGGAALPPHFRWAVPGRVAGAACPRDSAELAALHRVGIRAILSLTEQPLPEEIVNAAPLAFAHLPIPDFAAPTLHQMTVAVQLIDDFLREGSPVVVHCTAGLGRTGTILACYLVSQGMSATRALAEVRAGQPGSVETPGQEAAIALYELHWIGPRDGW